MREWYRRPGNAEAQRQTASRSRERRIDYVREYDRARGARCYDKDKQRARRQLIGAVMAGTELHRKVA
jgi:hypothetical protein